MVTEPSRTSLWPSFVAGALSPLLGLLVGRVLGLEGWASFGVALLVAVVVGAVVGRLTLQLRRRRQL
jgi:hypothetical protein